MIRGKIGAPPYFLLTPFEIFVNLFDKGLDYGRFEG